MSRSRVPPASGSKPLHHNGPVNLEGLAALRTPAGLDALALAADLAGGDPLTAAAALRSAGVPGDLAAAALTQAELRRRAAGVADHCTIECADATRFDIGRVDAVFCDPARRRAGTGRRVFDPAAYSPSWDFVTALAERVPRTVLKVAPGLDHALIPPGTEAEWVSVDGDLVEAALWYGPLARVPRRATLVRTEERAPVTASGSGRGPSRQLTGSGTRDAPVGPVRRYVYDPDGAVVRARLVAEFAATVAGTLADPNIAYVYADAPVATAFGRCLEITDVLPFSLKRLRALLRERTTGRVEILKRGSALEPERLRRDLRLAGPEPATLVLTRVAGAPTVLVCRPVPDPAVHPAAAGRD